MRTTPPSQPVTPDHRVCLSMPAWFVRVPLSGFEWTASYPVGGHFPVTMQPNMSKIH